MSNFLVRTIVKIQLVQRLCGLSPPPPSKTFIAEHLDVLSKTTNFALLRIALDKNMNAELRNFYKNHVFKHNNHIVNDTHANSGFDLLTIHDVTLSKPFESTLIDSNIKTEMLYYNKVFQKYEPSAYYLLPRSSLSNSPLISSVHVGVIDSGYRGNVKIPIRFLPASEPTYTVKSKTRIVQICHPTLCPIYVVLVEEDDLSVTSRGIGGFGSTGQ